MLRFSLLKIGQNWALLTKTCFLRGPVTITDSNPSPSGRNTGRHPPWMATSGSTCDDASAETATHKLNNLRPSMS